MTSLNKVTVFLVTFLAKFGLLLKSHARPKWGTGDFYVRVDFFYLSEQLRMWESHCNSRLTEAALAPPLHSRVFGRRPNSGRLSKGLRVGEEKRLPRAVANADEWDTKPPSPSSPPPPPRPRHSRETHLLPWPSSSSSPSPVKRMRRASPSVPSFSFSYELLFAHCPSPLVILAGLDQLIPLFCSSSGFLTLSTFLVSRKDEE